jgi:predicted DNA-binding WGR domain protein
MTTASTPAPTRSVPYFVYHGTNPDTLGGTSAKGYWIFRSGSRVVARWGAVDVAGGRGGTFRWRTQPNEKTWTFRSEDEAKRHLRAKVHQRHRSGYDELPSGRKIERASRS